MTDTVTIGNDRLQAVIAAKGAELVSLKPSWGDEVIWQGDPAIWPWHAPNLFPIVGALADDTLVHHGRHYPMKQHGFLRHSRCAVTEASGESCAFRLVDTAETRAQYPFAFALTIRYRLVGDVMAQSFELANPAPEPLYASIGAHPAFRWPLTDGVAREAYRVIFEHPEPAPVRRLAGRGLGGGQPTPVEGKVLPLRDSLFDTDAVIFDQLRSRLLRFGSPEGAGIELGFSDFPHFGLWTKPGGTGFLCLEPWQGYASPTGFAGEFADKPGIATIAPGATKRWELTIRPIPKELS
jgi:galactose mutarotase-like enzyme